MTAGGKDLNVSKVIKICGEEIQATGFVGGHNGELVKELLQKDEIKSKFINTKSETRNCINILDQDNISTEFLEPGQPISKYEKELFIKEFDKILDNTNVVTISGSAPQGLNKDIYKVLIDMAKAKDKKVILDTISAANALTNSTGSFKQEDAESIYKDIEITKINIEN